jgi:hypothetical protein
MQPQSKTINKDKYKFDNAQLVDLKDIDLDAVIATHRDWELQLSGYITQKPDTPISPKMIFLDNQCTLGKWLHDSGQMRFGSHQSFTMLVAQHRRFHFEAAKVIALANATKFVEASQRLDKNFAYASRQLNWLLLNLKNNLRFMELG